MVYAATLDYSLQARVCSGCLFATCSAGNITAFLVYFYLLAFYGTRHAYHVHGLERVKLPGDRRKAIVVDLELGLTVTVQRYIQRIVTGVVTAKHS